jgi:hypothetical protein
MGFIDTTCLTRTFSRSYSEESDLAFSAIDCVLNGEKGVYASSELTTGRRVQSVLREIGVRRSSDLRPRLGDQEYVTRIWNPNVDQALTFARRLHHTLGGNQRVMTPAPFMAPGWGQSEYLAFWESLIRTRIKAVYFNEGWEFSNGCTFEYLVAFDAGLPTFDAAGMMIESASAIVRIAAAIETVRQDGLDADALVRSLSQMQELAASDRTARGR